MLKTNYANAYKEVLVILDNLKKEDYNKIPKAYIEFLTKNCNKDYVFYYDNSKTFEQQELLDDTKYILFGMFEKFGSTELQKKKIKAFKNSYYRKLEEEKKAKYNTDIFQDRNKNKQEKYKEEITTNEVAMAEYKDSLFRKIINKIKKYFINNIKLLVYFYYSVKSVKVILGDTSKWKNFYIMQKLIV